MPTNGAHAFGTTRDWGRDWKMVKDQMKKVVKTAIEKPSLQGVTILVKPLLKQGD